MNEGRIKLFLLLTVLFISDATTTFEEDCVVLYLRDQKLLNPPFSSKIQKDLSKHEECLNVINKLVENFYKENYDEIVVHDRIDESTYTK